MDQELAEPLSLAPVGEQRLPHLKPVVAAVDPVRRLTTPRGPGRPRPGIAPAMWHGPAVSVPHGRILAMVFMAPGNARHL
ncbi:hypothetical protein GCM10010199_47040 [Dactylosporangium roseum]